MIDVLSREGKNYSVKSVLAKYSPTYQLHLFNLVVKKTCKVRWFLVEFAGFLTESRLM